MALFSITQSQPSAITGVNVDPSVFYSWDLKALFPSAAAGDVIESPALNLNAVSPKCNRLVIHKLQTVAGTDLLKILVSPNGTEWYVAPLYNGGVSGGTASSAVSANELAMTGLPTMIYVKAQLTLAGAMSTQTVSKLALSLMRI